MTLTAPYPSERPNAPLTVIAESDAVLLHAQTLAEKLGAPLRMNEAEGGAPEMSEGELALLVAEDGLSLASGTMRVRGDLARMLPRLRTGNLHKELLVKAAKVKSVAAPIAIDATAGLGEDALLLAAAGFSVTLCERDPVIAALLDDALHRAAQDERLACIVARMELVKGDSADVLRSLETPPDVVLLDPMFPEKAKSSSVKKKLQLIQRLERPCEDERALVEAAIAAMPRKIVIKRPVKGPHLAGVKPDYSLAGKAVRYDCLVAPRYGHRPDAP